MIKRVITSLAVISGFVTAGYPFFAGESLSPLAEGYIERARLMMKENNAAGAIDQIGFLFSEEASLSEEEREECIYILAMALYERGDEECVDLLREFAAKYPSSLRSPKAMLAAADWFFYAGRYGSAVVAYSEIVPESLDVSDRRAYEYRMALSMVKAGLLDEGREIFMQLRDIPEYNVASDYYLAYIDYARGNYPKALEGFTKTKNKLSRTSGEGIYPDYYIAQIEYIRGNYDEVISLGKKLLSNSPDETLVPETRRVVGLSQYNTGKNADAEKTLREYLATPAYSHAPDAVYALGEIEFENGNLEESRRLFSLLTDEDNELGQGAYLFLGQIAASGDDVDSATLYFQRATEMDYDSALTETAMYNYIVARMKGGTTPFSSSAPLLEKFAQKYPASQYIDEVQDYLATAYYNEKDYEKALQSLRKIKEPSARMTATRQKVLFELGKQSVANNNPSAAVDYLAEAIDIDSDKKISSEAILWQAEALYSLGRYDKAANGFRNYLRSGPSEPSRSLAYYNLGYASLMEGKYKDALSAFKEALKNGGSLQKNLYDDALIRLADAEYYTGDYRGALRDYSEAMERGADESDYAYYRRSVMRGLHGDTSTKLSELNSMEKMFPNSRWLPAALLEAGQTYTSLGEYGNAVKAYERLRNINASAESYRTGLLDLARAYMKTGREEEATASYREIISQWPTSEEAAIANDDLRDFYAENGGLREYSEFLRSIPGAPSLNENEIEKIEFNAAANSYADNGNVALLQKYVSDYPSGRYLAEALLSIAYAAAEDGNDAMALEAVDDILEKRPDAPQVAEALAMKGEILEGMGIARAADALATYRLLEEKGGVGFAPAAYAGIMRLTPDEKERLEYARRVKASGGLSSEVLEEAEFYEGVALLHQGDTDGEKTLQRLASNPMSLTGSKSAVTLGEYYLDAGLTSKAEETLKQFTGAGSPHQYWLARGFIILADTYHKTGKEQLAIEYLKSLKENYPGKELDIQDMIETRLKKWGR